MTLKTCCRTLIGPLFFQTFELRGRYPNRGYPKIFNDANVGPQAQSLFDDGQRLLTRIIKEKLYRLKGTYGIYPASRMGEHVQVYDPTTTTAPDGSVDPTSSPTMAPLATFCMLRQQQEKENTAEPYLSLADFIAPSDDYLGMFAVGCFGVEDLAASFDADHDDYHKILAQALGDRLVEAFAEMLHRDIRTKHWGYAANETLDPESMLKIRYDGIRPAPGYPSQPDHTEKETMWALMDVTAATGIELTSSLAMSPAASVSALVFAHPESEYFAVGKIDSTQVQSYAAAKKQTVSKVEKWLSPILNYERENI